MSARVPVTLTVISGRFDNQREAFGAIVDASYSEGVTVDLADVDVISSAANVRLAHYFRPAIVARIQAMQGVDNTLLILRPSEATQKPGFLANHTQFRRLGVFAGTIIEPGED